MLNSIDPAYPRPQFVRSEWQSLDGLWQYSFDPTNRFQEVAWQGEILTPYPPEASLSGVGDPGFHRVIWYRRSFRLPSAWIGRRVMLNFGAVDYFARVWVNGELAVEHEGGHTPFCADITDLLAPGEQEIVVRAEDDPLDLEKPRGKQDWEPEPHAIWYPRTTGIWQPVWIEPVSAASIERLRLTPDVDEMAFAAEVTLAAGASVAGSLSVEVTLSHGDDFFVERVLPVKAGQASGVVALPSGIPASARRDLLWSPENPVLFDLTLVLRDGARILDEVHSYAGLRSVASRGSEFLLNGEPYFMQLVLDQGYWAESLLAAPCPDALREDVELTKLLGFNGARKHQKIEDPRYLYWADRLGLLVWDELPSAYTFSGQTIRRVTAEFTALVERDYNHPCVVAWVPFNESWGIPEIRRSPAQRHLAQALYHLGKALDETRLVIENDGWEHCQTDLFTIHDYENLPEVFARRYSTDDCLDAAINHGKALALEGYNPEGLPVVLSEFGGIRLGSGKGWGYQTAASAEEFLSRFEPLMKTVYGRRLTGYCYTQLTDTFQEQNGLLDMNRRPKVDPRIIRRILAEGLTHRRALA